MDRLDSAGRQLTTPALRVAAFGAVLQRGSGRGDRGR
jgi:hypothetical protein